LEYAFKVALAENITCIS